LPKLPKLPELPKFIGDLAGIRRFSAREFCLSDSAILTVWPVWQMQVAARIWDFNFGGDGNFGIFGNAKCSAKG
jgi:hypothetical protein